MKKFLSENIGLIIFIIAVSSMIAMDEQQSKPKEFTGGYRFTYGPYGFVQYDGGPVNPPNGSKKVSVKRDSCKLIEIPVDKNDGYNNKYTGQHVCKKEINSCTGDIYTTVTILSWGGNMLRVTYVDANGL